MLSTRSVLQSTFWSCKWLYCKALIAFAGRTATASSFCGRRGGGDGTSGTTSQVSLCSRKTIPAQGTKHRAIIQPNCHKNPSYPTCPNQWPAQPRPVGIREKLLPFQKWQSREMLGGSVCLCPREQLSLLLTFLATLFYALRPCFCIRLCADYPKLAAYKCLFENLRVCGAKCVHMCRQV